MSASRVCTECGSSLEGRHPAAVTCSSKCRQDRKRRLDREEKAPGVREALADQDPYAIARRVMEEELRPVARAAITDEVLEAFAMMVSLAPDLVRSLAADLSNPDPVARGRAQTLLSKYIFAGQEKGPPEDRSLHVHLPGMPTPQPSDANNTAVISQELISDEPATGARQCERCGLEKQEEAFEGNARRCRQCQAEVRQALLEQARAAGV